MEEQSDPIAQAEEYEKKAEKRLNLSGFFCSDGVDLPYRLINPFKLANSCLCGSGAKYEDAAALLYKAADAFKLGKSWDKAGSTYFKLANCLIKLESKHEAALAYDAAAHCYKKINARETIYCLEQAVSTFCDIGAQSMAARCYKEFAELYESEQNIVLALLFFQKAADMFPNEEVTAANQCKHKVAQYAAELEQYQKAIEIYEEIAKQSLDNNLPKYGVKDHLLNAGICQLCKGDIVAITNALKQYQDMDPTFAGTREYRLLADIAASIDEVDVAKFTDVVQKFDSMIPLDSWKKTLLLRVKEKLKAKELEEDDLT